MLFKKDHITKRHSAKPQSHTGPPRQAPEDHMPDEGVFEKVALKRHNTPPYDVISLKQKKRLDEIDDLRCVGEYLWATAPLVTLPGCIHGTQKQEQIPDPIYINFPISLHSAITKNKIYSLHLKCNLYIVLLVLQLLNIPIKQIQFDGFQK